MTKERDEGKGPWGNGQEEQRVRARVRGRGKGGSEAGQFLSQYGTVRDFMTSRAGTLPSFPVPGEEEISVGVRPQSPPRPLEEDSLPPRLSLLCFYLGPVHLSEG